MKDKILMILSVIQTIALISILVVLINNGQQAKPKQVRANLEAHSIKQEPIKLNENDPVWGSTDAKLTMVVYVDYECPYCKDVYKNIKEIEEEYIKTGVVKVIIRDLPLKMHPNAEKIAWAAECARKQGKFWEFADIALTNTEKFTEDMLAEWAKLLDLDLESCIDDTQTKDIVLEDIKNAQTRRLRGTPAIFINDEYYRGTMSASDMKLIFKGKKPTKKRSGVCNQK